jgi:adenylylsulfate kinase
MDLIYSNHLPTGRKEKEARLKQKAKVIWLTGLSGSGKTTLGLGLEKEMFKMGYFVEMLDGDLIRRGINNNLSFTVEDRTENIRRIAEVSRLFLDSGIITIDCFISPTREIRELARDIIGKEDFIEIYLDAPLYVCEGRDVKGLYARARKGEIPFFTGITSPYEPPDYPALVINTNEMGIEETIGKSLEFILPHITLKE